MSFFGGEGEIRTIVQVCCDLHFHDFDTKIDTLL